MNFAVPKITLFGMTVRRAEDDNFSESTILSRRHILTKIFGEQVHESKGKLAIITQADLKPVTDNRLLQETFIMTSSRPHHSLMASSDQQRRAPEQDLGERSQI